MEEKSWVSWGAARIFKFAEEEKKLKDAPTTTA